MFRCCLVRVPAYTARPMKKPEQPLDTTQVDPLSADATEAMVTLPSDIPFPAGKGMSQLVPNFNAIVEERAIYYPVAYRFLRELGRGRQGIVYLGLRQGARGSVTRHAIKVFDPAIYANAKKYWTDMGRIAAQTSKLQTVKNPNLVAPDIYEEFNGIGYLQMGLVDGMGIRTLLDGQHLERVRRRSTPQEWARFMDVIFREKGGKLAIQPGIAIYIARRILRGLETLHDLGFVHCDVKPANVMLDRLGYVKLIDYGRAVTASEKVTMLLGTPLYMAPEAHRRELATTQSDIYSTGLVLLEMLRGEPLLSRAALTEADLLQFKMGLREHLPNLLPEHVRQNTNFVEVMRRFLDPDPARRYATAQEADASRQGLIIVHKQLALAGKDTEYGRELENYLGKLVNPLTGQVETGDVVTPAS
jgi:eukaryotic-like serine/threonine-protein kinase